MTGLITSVPYESSVSVRQPDLVGWCPNSETYDKFSHSGACWMCDGDEDEKPHRVHKRRFWICPICEAGYTTRAALLDHEHWWP